MASSLDNVQTLTGRLSGKYGLLSGALGDDEAKKFVQTLARLDTLDSALFAEPCLWERPLAWSTDEEQALKRLSRSRR